MTEGLVKIFSVKAFKIVTSLFVIVLFILLGIWVWDGYGLYKLAWGSESDFQIFETLESRSPQLALVFKANYDRETAKSHVTLITSAKLEEKGYPITQMSFQKRTFRLLAYVYLIIGKTEACDRILNSAYFGYRSQRRVVGIQQAARYFLSKDLAQLSIADAALLVTLEGPDVLPPSYKWVETTTKKRDHLIDKLNRLNIISTEEAEKAKSIPVASIGDGQ